MPLNELGQTVNNAGNILCLKIGTTKKQYLSPHTVRNTELMKLQGWEVIMKPELPPSFTNGKSNYSSGSYEENNSQGTTTTDPKGEYNLNQPEEINEENGELNKPDETFEQLEKRVLVDKNTNGLQNPVREKDSSEKYLLEPGGRKRGRPFGSKSKKKSKLKK